MGAYPRSRITGAVLAGGRARRMGGQDKGLVEIGGRPLIEYVLAALEPQVGAIAINANRNLEAYREYGHAVYADTRKDYPGPLAGVAALMAHCESELLLSVPCDTPLLPDDLAARLHAALSEQDAHLATAHDGARMQPTFALLRRDLLASLHAYLDGGGRKIDTWYAEHKVALADFSDRPETFLNVNTPEDCAAVASRLPEA